LRPEFRFGDETRSIEPTDFEQGETGLKGLVEREEKSMHRKNLKMILLPSFVLILGLTAVSFPSHAQRWGTLGIIGSEITHQASSDGLSSSAVLSGSDSSAVAPEFAAGTWINSEPLTLKGLRRRVVLVEFWTFGCYNCRNTLPAVKRLDARYREQGLTVDGVHSPETGGEKNLASVRREVASLAIKYPVVTDNEFELWRAYNVDAWPTIFVLDKAGRIRWKHVGEGAYDQTEQVIQRLLAEDE